MIELHHDHLRRGNTKPLLHLRFNPNSYTRADGSRDIISASDMEQAEPKRRFREALLLETIANHEFDAENSMEVVYMYYNYVTENQYLQGYAYKYIS